MESAYTIKEPTEGIYKEKGSRFLAFAFPVSSREEVETRLTELRKAYFDARHHCYAYRLGIRNQTYRAYDDGEPNHSAGDPILGQIRSFELTNVLVVVIRYFGGVKLGVGGLVRAYKEATIDALQRAEKVEIFEKVRFTLRFSYEQTAQVERLLNDFEIKYLERTYNTGCTIICEVRETNGTTLITRLRSNGFSVE